MRFELGIVQSRSRRAVIKHILKEQPSVAYKGVTTRIISRN